MNIFIKSILSIVTIVFITSCSNSNNEEPEIIIPECRRTVLVYMVATNSLGAKGFDELDMEEMRTAMGNYKGGDCRFLVYRVVYNQVPRLIEIKNEGDKAVDVVLKNYTPTLHASVTKQRFAEVINDVKTLAPAKDYGLILWSHSDGWATSLLYKSVAKPRDFGEDNGAKMHIDSLADALPEHTFSFIYADACYMGAIEVAYQLRKKIDYFVGSPAELPANGMQYDKNIPCFFEEEPDLLQACRNTFDYYNSLSGDSRTLTISLIDCSKLDKLASVCKEIHSSALPLTSVAGLQYYNRFQPRFFYDFGQYTNLIAANESLKEKFNEALGDAVIYKACTPAIFGSLFIDSENYSGLSTYIMGQGSIANEEYYLTLDWYKDVLNN